MQTVYKDGCAIEVREGAQLDAFLRSGWTAEKPGAEPQEKPEQARKAPARKKPQAK